MTESVGCDAVKQPRHPVGFPSGALAGIPAGDALWIFRESGISCPEIHPQYLGDPLFGLGRSLFDDASIHLPSYLDTEESYALAVAREALGHGYERLIVHPYVVRDPALWRGLGSALVLENMDFRSPGFRSAQDMVRIFEELPQASFCLDVGHTFSWRAEEASRLIDALSSRLVCVHYSEVDRGTGDHLSTVSEETLVSHAMYLKLLPRSVPVIMEVGGCTLAQVLDLRQRLLASLN